MKLEPRERKPLPNYILDNAASLNLGKLYLGWNRKTSRPTERVYKYTHRKKKSRKYSRSKPLAVHRNKLTMQGQGECSLQPTPTPFLSERLENHIDITVCFVNGETLSLPTSSAATVSALEQQIREVWGGESAPILYYDGALLHPGDTLEAVGLINKSIVLCITGDV